MDFGSLLSSLNNIGLEDFEVANGAPVGITTVGANGTTTVGSVLTGNSGTLLILAALLVIFLLVR